MKRFALYLGLATALVTSCSIQEEDFKTQQKDDVVFYATFEQPSEQTKVYANEDLYLRWTADDRVSIFNKLTYNQLYKFTGNTGANAGGFKMVDSDEFVTGNSISHVVSVYPYQETTEISESEVLTLTLPAEQNFAESSFGLEANTMVSVSSDNVLQYKNVGGYLRLSLYGDGVTVSSITLKGNNGEKLAGKATVTMPLNGIPTAVLASNGTTEITLVCDTPVKLGETLEESTQFWFVVPPVTFSKGFTVTVSGKGGGFEKHTDKTLTIERNKLSKMAPIEVELSQSKNVIYYTSLGGNVVTPNNSEAFGASIVSNEYVEGVGKITFDGDVTSIGESAFFDCTSLTNITIPEGVTSIGDMAFSSCTRLTSITIPESLTSIGDRAFSHCIRLTSITIPEGVTSIGDRAFQDCDGLTSITIPGSVTSIGGWAFWNCRNLTSITIPGSVTSIGVWAFHDCKSLTNITIQEGVTSIGDGAFGGCTRLTNITIPEGVTSIGVEAFCYCRNLTSITIPESLTSIGDDAFSYCKSLISITIPEGVTSIGDWVFYECRSLTSITIPGSVTSIGDNAFAYCESLTSITIPGSVTSIGGGAFGGCTRLTSITIPESVTSIGDGAFGGCTRLTSITIPESVTSIGDGAFSDCESLTSITIPEGVTSIGGRAFSDCDSLTSITIPEGVTSIGDSAFFGCDSLTSITIPGSVTSIGGWAFAYCGSLSSITILSLTPPKADSYLFFLPSDMNKCPIYVPAGSVDEYKATSPWSDYADHIFAIGTSVPVAVDLGFSVKWGSYNVGASKPEECGDYFAWGEMEHKDFYDWSTYNWPNKYGSWNDDISVFI